MIRHFIDQPSTWTDLSACLIVKGWCFAADGRPIRGIRLRTGAYCFSGVIGLPRPDVRAVFPEAPSDDTGFDVRGVLPTGKNQIRLEAQTLGGTWYPIFDQEICIKKSRRPLWLPGSSWTELMFFQMASQMKHPPRPLKADRLPRPTLPAAARPRISVVTPSFQQALFLPATLRSVTEENDVNFEYVIQDGGSSDGSAEVLREFAGITRPSKSRSIIWASESDGGQADAIARAFSKTSGNPADLMAWINSDDFYLPGTLAYVTDYFARHPKVDVLYGHRILIDEESREIGRWFLPPHDNEVLKLNDFIPQETMFWRRRIWEQVGGIDPSLKFAMDWDLLLRFQAAGAKIVRVPYFLACFRIHSAQKTSAQMESIGQKEINALRQRTFGRVLPPSEIETHPRLLRYLRKSAWIEFLWRRLRIRHP